MATLHLKSKPSERAKILQAFEAFRQADRNSEGRAHNELVRLRNVEREKLAAERGWTISRYFTLQELKEGRRARRGLPYDIEGLILKHPDFFKLGQQPIAIVSHTYAPWEKCVEFAQDHRLDAEKLDFSWYYPGGTLAVLFTRCEV
jgi:hypothetical protein